MKKQIITTLLAISWMAMAKAQTPCTPPTAQAVLNANQVRANILAGGDNFWDFADGRYQVPYQAGLPTPTSIFAHSLWIGGFDAGNNLHLAAQTYRQDGDDYWSGGLDENGQADSLNCGTWNKVWTVKKTDILTAQNLFAAGQLSLSNCPVSLLKWPAQNNPYSLTNNGFEINTSFAAPYFDVNGDAIYDPLMGDYPVLQTSPSISIPDEMTFSLNNDKGNVHTEADGLALGIQFQKIDYAFDSPTSPINRTTFTRYVIQNKSGATYHDVKIGLWTDFDLGCYEDDYVGTSVPNNAVYAYNADNDDATCSGVLGYGLNPPVQSIQFLNRTMTNSMFYYNNVGSSPTYLNNPNATADYYNYLSSKWKDNTPLTQGNNGYGGTTPTNYAFEGNPNNSNEWSMQSVSMVVSDYRVLATTTEQELQPGETVTIDVAFTFHREENRTNLENVNLMEQELPIVRDFYNQRFSVATTNKNPSNQLSVALYPNPTSGNVVLNIDSPITDVELTLYNPSGTRINQQTVKAGTNTVPIILPNVSGMYILQGISTDGKVFTKKVIKQ